MFTLTITTAVWAGLCILVLGFIIWFIAAALMDSSEFKKKDLEKERVEALYLSANAEVESLHLARKMQQKRYDDLYAHMLAVNAQNTKLAKELSAAHFTPRKEVEERVKEDMEVSVKAQLLSHSFSKEMWDAVYNLFLRGATRKEIAQKFGVSYANVCKIIREKDRKQDPLF